MSEETLKEKFKIGERAFYYENREIDEVEIIENTSNDTYEEYKLKILNVLRNGPYTKVNEKGEEFEYRKLRNGSCQGIGFLFDAEYLEAWFGIKTLSEQESVERLEKFKKRALEKRREYEVEKKKKDGVINLYKTHSGTIIIELEDVIYRNGKKLLPTEVQIVGGMENSIINNLLQHGIFYQLIKTPDLDFINYIHPIISIGDHIVAYNVNNNLEKHSHYISTEISSIIHEDVQDFVGLSIEKIIEMLDKKYKFRSVPLKK